MQVLCCTEPGNMQIEERPRPVLTEGHAILQIKRIGVCGTDLHAYQGRQPYFKYPRIFGHEISGVIAEIAGNEYGFEKGETVTVIPYYSCGHCIACSHGKSNCCVQIQVLGVHIDGGLSEYIAVPVSYLVKSHGLIADQLAIVEPFAIAAHALERAAIQKDEWVMLLGAGPIGLAIAQLAAGRGARLMVLDSNPFRLECCRKAIPGISCWQPGKEDILPALKEVTNNTMPTLVVDATGNLTAINSGFRYMAHGGRYVLVGLQSGDISFSHPEFHKREATLMSSRNATRRQFDEVISLMKAGVISEEHYITHRLHFREAANSFQDLIDPHNHVLKAVISLD